MYHVYSLICILPEYNDMIIKVFIDDMALVSSRIFAHLATPQLLKEHWLQINPPLSLLVQLGLKAQGYCLGSLPHLILGSTSWIGLSTDLYI